jgi:DNA-binding NtrC family response regulator
VSDQTLNGHLCRLVGELVKQGISLQQANREFERQYLLAALRAYAGSLSRSATALGVHRNTLRTKMAALRIEPDDIAARPRRRAAARKRPRVAAAR